MIPSYNCDEYLRETVASVLAQDPGPDVMQIQVVDDHSTTGNPEALVHELGRGRVEFFRQSRNVGYVANFETCLQRSRGTLVHLLHGDDCVRPGFYERLQTAFEHDPDVGAAFCRHIYMDEHGNWNSISPLERDSPGIVDGWLPKIASGQRVATPSVVVRRAIYEALGGFDRRFTCAGEDWEMWVRIAAHAEVWFEPQPLATYRVRRPGSLTHDSAQSTRLVSDMRLATDIIAIYLPSHLPDDEARAALARARQIYAFWALEASADAATTGDVVAMLAHTREALACSRSAPVILHAVGIPVRAAIRRAARFLPRRWPRRAEP